MSNHRPRGLRRYDKVRKLATFEFIVPGSHGGRRIQKTFKVTSWEDAVEKGDLFRRDMATVYGDAASGGEQREPITFSQYVMREWERTFVPRLSKGKRITNWSIIKHHLIPYFGAMVLSRISDSHVEDFVAAMKAKPRSGDENFRYSPAYINAGLSLLRTFLRNAYRRRVIREFPLREPLPLLAEPKLRNELTTEEETRFLAAFDDETMLREYIRIHSKRGNVVSSPRFGSPRIFGGGMKWDREAAKDYFDRFHASKALFSAALHTGLRRDDLRLLKWSSVDLGRRVITVVMKKTREVAVIPISKPLSEILHSLRRSTVIGECVFLTSEGRPYSVTTINRYFAIAKQLAGITRRFRFHDVRHTFGSKLASAGVSTAIIRRCLGHTSSRMAERYAFPSEEAVRGIVSALDGGPADAPVSKSVISPSRA